MIITFLGTAAANAYPEAFCSCANCREARRLGGTSLRKRSAILVNDDLLVDLGPDIMSACQQHGCSLENVGHCLQTHPHSDHLDLSHLLSRSHDFGTIAKIRLNFYASQPTLERATQTFERDLAGYSLLSAEAEKRLNVTVHRIEPFRSFVAGRYRVTPYPANHAPGLGALLYAIEAGAHCIFYGTDTGALEESTWRALHANRSQFDVVILDHTYGPEQEGIDHLSARQFAQHVDRMRRDGLMKVGARAFATHIAHEGNPPHPELAKWAEVNGYEVAHDGLVLEV